MDTVSQVASNESEADALDQHDDALTGRCPLRQFYEVMHTAAIPGVQIFETAVINERGEPDGLFWSDQKDVHLVPEWPVVDAEAQQTKRLFSVRKDSALTNRQKILTSYFCSSGPGSDEGTPKSASDLAEADQLPVALHVSVAKLNPYQSHHQSANPSRPSSAASQTQSQGARRLSVADRLRSRMGMGSPVPDQAGDQARRFHMREPTKDDSLEYSVMSQPLTAFKLQMGAQTCSLPEGLLFKYKPPANGHHNLVRIVFTPYLTRVEKHQTTAKVRDMTCPLKERLSTSLNTSPTSGAPIAELVPATPQLTKQCDRLCNTLYQGLLRKGVMIRLAVYYCLELGPSKLVFLWPGKLELREANPQDTERAISRFESTRRDSQSWNSQRAKSRGSVSMVESAMSDGAESVNNMSRIGSEIEATRPQRAVIIDPEFRAVQTRTATPPPSPRPASEQNLQRLVAESNIHCFGFYSTEGDRVVLNDVVREQVFESVTVTVPDSLRQQPRRQSSKVVLDAAALDVDHITLLSPSNATTPAVKSLAPPVSPYSTVLLLDTPQPLSPSFLDGDPTFNRRRSAASTPTAESLASPFGRGGAHRKSIALNRFKKGSGWLDTKPFDMDDCYGCPYTDQFIKALVDPEVGRGYFRENNPEPSMQFVALDSPPTHLPKPSPLSASAIGAESSGINASTPKLQDASLIDISLNLSSNTYSQPLWQRPSKQVEAVRKRYGKGIDSSLTYIPPPQVTPSLNVSKKSRSGASASNYWSTLTHSQPWHGCSHIDYNTKTPYHQNTSKRKVQWNAQELIDQQHWKQGLARKGVMPVQSGSLMHFLNGCDDIQAEEGHQPHHHHRTMSPLPRSRPLSALSTASSIATTVTGRKSLHIDERDYADNKLDTRVEVPGVYHPQKAPLPPVVEFTNTHQSISEDLVRGNKFDISRSVSEGRAAAIASACGHPTRANSTKRRLLLPSAGSTTVLEMLFGPYEHKMSEAHRRDLSRREQEAFETELRRARAEQELLGGDVESEVEYSSGGGDRDPLSMSDTAPLTLPRSPSKWAYAATASPNASVRAESSHRPPTPLSRLPRHNSMSVVSSASTARGGDTSRPGTSSGMASTRRLGAQPPVKYSQQWSLQRIHYLQSTIEDMLYQERCAMADDTSAPDAALSQARRMQQMMLAAMENNRSEGRQVLGFGSGKRGATGSTAGARALSTMFLMVFIPTSYPHEDRRDLQAFMRAIGFQRATIADVSGQEAHPTTVAGAPTDTTSPSPLAGSGNGFKGIDPCDVPLKLPNSAVFVTRAAVCMRILCTDVEEMFASKDLAKQARIQTLVEREGYCYVDAVLTCTKSLLGRAQSMPMFTYDSVVRCIGL